ncbi:glutathione S-transferase family protein [Cupriavidus plantarum]|uniref:Glutathione S-transferase n=1 Tax=Cupriavidus plantarum TaxID=942865 RepID=A0A316EQ66_9BURK|nr:glutathione S-transferase [Cupriavidus plantarum]NYI01582.1 glutathione S-transferase [Cupriavidus plantarum]PWK33719.1 glutathione S-transferase [Cupriavidus plantarum]REE90898.1 glutathione S-transferase [Cupriavidus plantarum]RLK33569.1 glutathione S-transferase [Cupriavidus plantarum]CAG2148676.1 Disulfide-bond oxidoreductase YfcG [Cupriavidus plantarum]
MKLYYHPLSGHSHRARLFLSLIGASFELVHVDLGTGAHKKPEFLKINPFGQVPVLVDGDTVVADSNAILVYLSKKFGKTDWLPETPAEAAAVQRWLSVAAGDIAFGPAAARLITVFAAPLDSKAVIARAHVVLKRMDDALAGREWIAASQPTVADVALYSYTARAPEGFVDLQDYANVRAWLERVEALPGFVEFQKTPVGLAA